MWRLVRRVLPDAIESVPFRDRTIVISSLLSVIIKLNTGEESSNKMKHSAILILVILFVSVPVAAQSSVRSVKPQDEFRHKSGFAVVNGIKVHYLDWGGPGEAVVFITGAGDSGHVFDEMAAKLSDQFRVLALTRRGYGESDKPETGYDVATLGEDVRQFLDVMKIKRAHLVGHSAGGNEMIWLAGRHRDRVLKLVFLDAAYDRREVAAIEAKDPLLVPEPKPDPDAPVPLKRKIQGQFFRYMDEFAPNYKKIKAPTLSYYAIFESHWDLKPDADEATRKQANHFIRNEVNPYQFRNAERFRKEVRKSRVVVLRDTDHYFFRDKEIKEEIANQVREFLLGK